MNLLCSAGERSLPWVLCQEPLECWQSQRAAWQRLPCINPSVPLLHDPPSTIPPKLSVPGSPRATLAQPYLLRAGRARQQEWHLLPNPGIWDLPAFQGAGSWDEQDVPSSPAPVSVPAPSIPGIHSACTCGCLYGGTVYILGSIMSISGYKCDLSVHIHLSHIYPPLASQEWEFFGLFCAAQTFKRKQKEKA